MVVEIDERSDLSKSHKRPGSQSLLTHDAKGIGGQATVRDLTDEEREALAPEPPEPVVVYVSAEPRPLSQREEEFVALGAAVITRLFEDHVVPRLERLWEEKARPALASKWAAMTRVDIAERSLRASQPKEIDALAGEVAQELAVEAPEESRVNMTSAEALARVLAALAAQAFHDEQLEAVRNANVEDAEGFAELVRTLSELPPAQLSSLLDAIEADPSFPDTEVRAELRRLLGLEHLELVSVPVDPSDPVRRSIP